MAQKTPPGNPSSSPTLNRERPRENQIQRCDPPNSYVMISFRRIQKSSNPWSLHSSPCTFTILTGSILRTETFIQNSSAAHLLVLAVQENEEKNKVSYNHPIMNLSGKSKQEIPKRWPNDKVLNVHSLHLPFENKTREPRNGISEESHALPQWEECPNHLGRVLKNIPWSSFLSEYS